MLKIRALSNLSVIVGKSGSGKSTLAGKIRAETSSISGSGPMVYISNEGADIFVSRQSRVLALVRRPSFILVWLFCLAGPAPAWTRRLGFQKPVRTLGLVSLWARAVDLALKHPDRMIIVDQGLFVLPSPLSRFGNRFLLYRPGLVTLPGHGYGTIYNSRLCNRHPADCPLGRLGFTHESTAHFFSKLSGGFLRNLGAEGSVLETLIDYEILVMW